MRQGLPAWSRNKSPTPRWPHPSLRSWPSASFALITLLSVPGLAVGIGLVKFKEWARILGLVLSALNLLNVPFGTILGGYGLWVLLNKETEPLFT